MIERPTCGTQRAEPQPPSDPHRQNTMLDARAPALSPNTRFGFKLFAQIIKDCPDENVLLSPSSIATALTMTYNGARGETRQAMAEALELTGMSLQEINQANAALWAALSSPDPMVELTRASSLWARRDLAYRSEFLQTARRFYDARVANLDFVDPAALLTINNWVKDKTAGKIKDLVKSQDLGPRTALVLLNAIYFKGFWTHPFDRAETSVGRFTLPDGRPKQIQMMSRTGWYDYCECQDFRAIKLPYGDGRLGMYVFVPSQEFALGAFLRRLSAGNWQKWLSWFDRAEGTVVLPRFTVEYEVELTPALKYIGMSTAFGPGADFSGISDGPLTISQVRHKAQVEVNEEGTEAVAATGVTVALTVPRLFTMVVDRPFFCAIREDETGEVLFMGSIVDPG